MLQNDIDYLSQGIAEMYSEMSTLKYIPILQSSNKANRYGEINLIHDEDNSFTVYGVFVGEADKSKDLDRKDPQSTNRQDGTIKLVFKQVNDRGIRIKDGDALDVINEYLEWDRYIITGVDKKIEMPMILTRLTVTKLNRMASE